MRVLHVILLLKFMLRYEKILKRLVDCLMTKLVIISDYSVLIMLELIF